MSKAVNIPIWVVDHDSFRRWARSDDFPERGQYFYLDGSLWIDLSLETVIHNQSKGVVLAVLGKLILDNAVGRYVGSRMMLTHVTARFSCEPDGMYFSNATFECGLATLENGDESLEIIGTPDMALEVVSKNSVKKDTVILMDLYAKAGIPEYWLVDSTVETPELEIYRLVSGKYVAARKHDGWVKSKVFSRSFRLTCRKDAKGVSHFNLETK